MAAVARKGGADAAATIVILRQLNDSITVASLAQVCCF
jgi:predicted PP-loop superfamily ATPase